MLTRIGSGLAVVLVAGAVGGILANFLTENDLFTGSDWQFAAALSLGIVLVTLVTFAAAGRPWRRRKWTPYW